MYKLSCLALGFACLPLGLMGCANDAVDGSSHALQSSADVPADGHGPLRRTCATRTPTDEEIAEVSSRILGVKGFGTTKAGKDSESGSMPGSIAVPVAFHVIHDGAQGYLSQAMIDDQMTVLNEGFASTPFRFELMLVDYTDNSAWFNMGYGSREERAAKQALRVGGAETLNVYTANPGDQQLQGPAVR
jgi:hypothetical protein